MRSGTSFFNLTLLKKQLSRFWPLWAGYALIWIYALPGRLLLQRSSFYGYDTPTERAIAFAGSIPELLPFLGQFLAIVFALAAAAAMFSYLYGPKSAGMMHALPIRREGLFLTHYAAGLAGLLAPHMLVWLLTLGAEAALGAARPGPLAVWLLAQSAMCFFYYSTAVFCAVFTGHLLALPVFYAVLNWFFMVITALVNILFREFLFGYTAFYGRSEEIVRWLTPVVQLATFLRWDAEGGALSGGGTLAVYAAAGLVLSAAALLVYRRRHVETAGDVVAVPLLQPVFKYGVALCTGLCLGMLTHALFGGESRTGLAVSLLIWTAIGYFAAVMLLNKTFRVWRSWKGCLAALAVMLIAILCVGSDLTGFVTRIPDAGRVTSVSLQAGHTAPYDDGSYLNEDALTDPGEIQKVLALHRAFVDARNGSEGPGGRESAWLSLSVDYTLTGGLHLRRHYNLSAEEGSALAEAAEALLCDPAVGRRAYRLDEVDPEQLTGFAVNCLVDADGNMFTYDATESEEQDPTAARNNARMLYEAVCADFTSGGLGRRYLFDQDPERMANTYLADLVLQWEGGEEDVPVWDNGVPSTQRYRATRFFTVTLTPQAENTLAVLRQLGVIREGDLRLFGETDNGTAIPKHT